MVISISQDWQLVLPIIVELNLGQKWQQTLSSFAAVDESEDWFPQEVQVESNNSVFALHFKLITDSMVIEKDTIFQ